MHSMFWSSLVAGAEINLANMNSTENEEKFLRIALNSTKGRMDLLKILMPDRTTNSSNFYKAEMGSLETKKRAAFNGTWKKLFYLNWSLLFRVHFLKRNVYVVCSFWMLKRRSEYWYTSHNYMIVSWKVCLLVLIRPLNLHWETYYF